MNKITQIINNRPVALLLQGKSIEELERRIEEYRKLDICWVSLGLFTTIEEFILSKINKKLDIVFDCATVPESMLYSYENNERLPRLENFLSRTDNNLWITSYGIVRDTLYGLHRNDFLNKFQSKMFIVDNLFPKKTISEYMSVPNSATLCLGALLSANPKNIVIFGLDGYDGDPKQGINSYYKSQYVSMERQNALNSISDEGINRDTLAFKNKAPTIIKKYKKFFKCHTSIRNCSPDTMYPYPTHTTYDEAKKWLV